MQTPPRPTSTTLSTPSLDESARRTRSRDDDLHEGSAPGDCVRAQGPQSGYQYLVVDRGSVTPHDVPLSRET